MKSISFWIEKLRCCNIFHKGKPLATQKSVVKEIQLDATIAAWGEAIENLDSVIALDADLVSQEDIYAAVISRLKEIHSKSRADAIRRLDGDSKADLIQQAEERSHGNKSA
jgi:hypothetical protein